MPDTAFTFEPVEMDAPEAPASQVFRVSVDNVTPLWPQVCPILMRALAGYHTHDPEDVRRMVLGQSAQLWVQYTDHVVAAVVSEFASYPKGVWVRIWLGAAAEGETFDSEAFRASLAAWRDMHACRGFEMIGRMGWLRRYPELRFVGGVLRSVTR